MARGEGTGRGPTEFLDCRRPRVRMCHIVKRSCVIRRAVLLSMGPVLGIVLSGCDMQRVECQGRASLLARCPESRHRHATPGDTRKAAPTGAPAAADSGILGEADLSRGGLTQAAARPAAALARRLCGAPARLTPPRMSVSTTTSRTGRPVPCAGQATTMARFRPSRAGKANCRHPAQVSPGD
jgi:hypothetical protein